MIYHVSPFTCTGKLYEIDYPQATEAIKYIAGIGKLLTNRLLVYDGLDMKFTEIVVKRDPNCEHCGHSIGRGSRQ